MKKLLIVSLILLLTSCTSYTKYGPCIGADDIEEENLIYKLSIWNITLSIIFIETIIVPLVVLKAEAKCPIAIKK